MTFSLIGSIMKNRKIAIIPSRGGSKRLPKKNILIIDSKPLLGHTIEQAFAANLFSNIIVSTEDIEIINIAKSYNAEIHIRSANLASDAATVADVCVAVLTEYFENPDDEVECFCVLIPTSILRTPDDIKRSYDIFSNGYDYTISVSEYFFYPHAALIVSEDGVPSYFWPEIATKKGQEVPKLVVENGAINWCKTKAFLANNKLLGQNGSVYLMPKYRSIDVDTEEDFVVLKALYNQLKKI